MTFDHHFNAGTDPQGVSGYDDDLDRARLVGQIKRIFSTVNDGRWWTLFEIEDVTGDPQASISAQLRHLRKERFGSHVVLKRKRGGEKSGLWEYKIDGHRYAEHTSDVDMMPCPTCDGIGVISA